MKFGPVPLDQAEGAILAHSEAVPGGRLRKGAVISGKDVARLAAAGVTEVVVARPEPGDVEENAAAARLAAALAGPDIEIGPASTGRVNLIARGKGLARVNAAAIDAVNSTDPMITVATVPDFQRMGPGGLIATVKIISYAVPEAALTKAAAAGQGGIGWAGPILRSAALIQTSVDGRTGKGAAALADRLAALDAEFLGETTVAHEIGPLAEAIRAAPGEAVFILTASATSDAFDTAPEALRAAGGTLTHFGMPVDPGNLLFLGALGARPVIGLPGCARSPALNGADWVIERVFCGIDVTPADIAAMGVGGLLKEIPSRPRPRRG